MSVSRYECPCGQMNKMYRLKCKKCGRARLNAIGIDGRTFREGYGGQFDLSAERNILTKVPPRLKGCPDCGTAVLRTAPDILCVNCCKHLVDVVRNDDGTLERIFLS